MLIIAIISVIAAVGSAIAAIFSAKASDRSAVNAEKSFLYNKEITKASIGIYDTQVSFDWIPEFVQITFLFRNVGREEAKLLLLDCKVISMATLKTVPLGERKVNFPITAGTTLRYKVKITLNAPQNQNVNQGNISSLKKVAGLDIRHLLSQ